MTPKEFEDRKAKAIQRLVDEHIEAVANVEQQTYERCAENDHLWDSFATGGRGGHCISRCMVCGHSVEGWD